MSWKTETEIAFIKGIGMDVHGAKCDRVMLSTRKKLLEGYLNGIKYRENWGDMDKNVVIAFAREELRQL